MQYALHNIYLDFQKRWRQSWIVLLALLTTTFVVLTSCVQEPERPLSVGLPQWVGFADFYLAEELNYYKEAPIRLLDYPSGSIMFQAFQNSELDVLCSSMAEALRLVEVDPTVRVVLLVDSSHGADVLLAKPSIKQLADLAGQRVGVEISPAGAYMLNRALEYGGLSPKDVQIVPTGVDEQESAYQTGKVDAVVTYEPIRSHLLAANASQLFDSSQIPGEIVDVLVIHNDLFKHRELVLQSLIKGWFKARQYAEQHPQEAAAKVAPLQNLTPEQYLQTLKGVRFYDLSQNQQALSGADPTLSDVTKRLSEIMQQQNLLKQPLDPKDLIDNQLVKNLTL